MATRRAGRKKGRENVIQKVRQAYDQLNETNRKIADFIVQNLAMAAYSPLAVIAKETGVSDTTLVRFARELGYRGYQELREDLVEHIRRIINIYEKPAMLVEERQHPILNVVMNKDIEYITSTMANINQERFDQLIEQILAAKRIFSMGWGISSFLAEYLAYGLNLIAFDAQAVLRYRRPMIQQLLFLRKGDLLIVFDLLLYSAEILEAVEYAHSQHPEVKIVTITNDPLAQIVHYSDLNFICSMTGHEFTLISLTAAFCFINAIFEQLIAKNPKRAKQTMRLFYQWVQSSPLHYSRFDNTLPLLQKSAWGRAAILGEAPSRSSSKGSGQAKVGETKRKGEEE